jgi:hypothetical protein
MPPFSEKTHGEAYSLHRLAGGRAEKTTPLASEQSHIGFKSLPEAAARCRLTPKFSCKRVK